MRKLTTKEIVLLVVLIFIVSGALYYNYFFRPYQEKMIELDVNISTDNQRLLTLQNQQQSLIRDTEKLNNELAGVQEEFYDIPEGIDEPFMLVFVEETLSGIADESIIGFSPEADINEYYQTSQILIEFETTYPNLKIILDSFYNAPFRNRVVELEAYYQDPNNILDTQLPPDDEEEDGGEAAEEPAANYLKVEMSVDCFTIPGVVNGKNYDFMIGPYNNMNPFEAPEEIQEPE